MSEFNYWSGKKVLITGGTSGLGKALAKEILSKGGQVAVVARNVLGLSSLRTEEPQIIAIQGDISIQDEIHRIHAETLEKLGDIDILVNNASSLGPTPLRLLIDTECEDLSLALQTNLVGPFRLTKLVLPSMLLRKTGLIVNISSDAAVQDYPTWGSYSVSKSALDHLTRIFQKELEHTGVKFLAIDPGDMDTPLHLAAIPDADRSQLHRPEDSARLLTDLIESEKYSPAHRGSR